MIVDTSALVAIVAGEVGSEDLAEAVLATSSPLMSAANAFEAAIVIDGRRNPVLSRALDRMRRELSIAIAPVTADHVEIARQAYRDFGKGSGHAADLNFGDCFAYALAKAEDQPLLFVGNDFAETDVEPAIDTAT